MDFPMEGAIYTCLAVIICWFMFCLFRRIRTRSKDVENDLKEPETDELDRRGKKKQRSKRIYICNKISNQRKRNSCVSTKSEENCECPRWSSECRTIIRNKR
ncbi:Cell wall integrity and stress response component [Trichinella spiralis]|uniref:Cell wall integrity and stress response component n=1 Tax=Trichinella spiralis TaxID=6334 RepID=A0ABR3KRB5_TRISP